MEHNNQLNSFSAQDLAGKAILFEIGAKAGLIDVIEKNESVTVDALAEQMNIKHDFLTHYLDVLTSLNILSKSVSPVVSYEKSSVYEQEKNKIGYIAWGMISCAPLLANTQAFISNFDDAVRTHHRCGEHVARTSKWMGGIDFYPHAQNAIINLKPKKVVDLGSGTCGLLMRLAEIIPGMSGVGVDLSKEACDIAKAQIKDHGLEDRIEVIAAPIQNLVNDNEIFANADVVHAGFVFHDLMPEEEETLNKLLAHIHQSSPQVTVVIVDAVPFSQNQEERAFSSAFTFLHKFFMGRKLQSESEWTDKLKQAGFTNIRVDRLGISGGRVFIASSNE